MDTAPTLNTLPTSPEKLIPDIAVKPKKPLFSLFTKILIVIFILILFSIFSVMFLTVPQTVNGYPILPFKNKQFMLGERITFMLREPQIGEIVTFINPTSGVDFFGVIINKDITGETGQYQILSSGTHPWTVTKDKITLRIYYPVVSKSVIQNIVDQGMKLIFIFPSSSPQIQVTTTPQPTYESYLYEISISSKPSSTPPPNEDFSLYISSPFNEYLPKIFGWLESESKFFGQTIEKAFYDTRKLSPYQTFYRDNVGNFQLNYYIYYEAIKPGLALDKSTYENNDVFVTVTPVNQSRFLEITTSEYCNIDTDCTIRTNFCTYGAFNYFSAYSPVWGCGPPSDQTGYTFDYFDEKMQCVTNVTYSGASCVNNKCEGIGRTVSCKAE